MPHLSHPPWLDHPNNIWWSVQVVSLLTIVLKSANSVSALWYLRFSRRRRFKSCSSGMWTPRLEFQHYLTKSILSTLAAWHGGIYSWFAGLLIVSTAYSYRPSIILTKHNTRTVAPRIEDFTADNIDTPASDVHPHPSSMMYISDQNS